MGLKILNISGGGTKIFGEAAVVKALYEGGLNPDIITGVSAGSYLAVPIAMRMFNEIDQMQQHLNLDTMFDPAPVNEKGKITIGAAWRVIKGSYWLGDQRKSLDLLKAVITPEIFSKYKQGWMLDGKPDRNGIQDMIYFPDVFLLSVDIRSGANNLVRVRDLTYEQYLDQTLASGSIPVFTKGVDSTKYQYDIKANRYFENGRALLFDGGIRNHIASTIIIEDIISRGKETIDEVISVYARPKGYDISKPSDWMPSDISTSITRTIDIMEMQLSKSDEVLEKTYAKMHGFKLSQLFLPSDMLNGTYDVDQTRLKAFYNACYVIGKDKPLEYSFNS